MYLTLVIFCMILTFLVVGGTAVMVCFRQARGDYQRSPGQGRGYNYSRHSRYQSPPASEVLPHYRYFEEHQRYYWWDTQSRVYRLARDEQDARQQVSRGMVGDWVPLWGNIGDWWLFDYEDDLEYGYPG